VERLRGIAALMARGHRPGRLIALSTVQLASLAGPDGSAAPGRSAHAAPIASDEDPVVGFLRRHDGEGLVRHLEDTVRSVGLGPFVTEQMPQMNEQVGACWARGDLQVYEEHLYTEAVQQLLRAALAVQVGPRAAAAPRVLLATFPDEGHGLGLLMAQVMLTLHGASCTSLGLKVPVPQLLAAARAFRADIVALSFSASTNPAHVLRGLEQLRGELSPQVAVWAGGSCPALVRRRIPGVQVIKHVRDVAGAVRAWRAVVALRCAPPS
jgi:methanogenic corrinoid protein MtbC1